MNFSEYRQVATPLKPRKAGSGGRRTHILGDAVKGRVISCQYPVDEKYHICLK